MFAPMVIERCRRAGSPLNHRFDVGTKMHVADRVAVSAIQTPSCICGVCPGDKSACFFLFWLSFTPCRRMAG